MGSKKTQYSHNDVDSLWQSFGGWYLPYKINDRTFQKIQNAAESELTGFESVYNKIIDYYSVLKEDADAHTEWDKKEVTERQTYMKEVEADIEISNYRLKDLSLGILEKEFLMRQDSSKQAKLVIEFANSTRGRNHFKNNYFRHIRIRMKFEEVLQEASNLIDEINNELNGEN